MKIIAVALASVLLSAQAQAFNQFEYKHFLQPAYTTRTPGHESQVTGAVPVTVRHTNHPGQPLVGVVRAGALKYLSPERVKIGRDEIRIVNVASSGSASHDALAANLIRSYENEAAIARCVRFQDAELVCDVIVNAQGVGNKFQKSLGVELLRQGLVTYRMEMGGSSGFGAGTATEEAIAARAGIWATPGASLVMMTSSLKPPFHGRPTAPVSGNDRESGSRRE